MKDASYFSHDYNARNDEKMLMVRARFNNAEGYGIVWFLYESLAESTDGYLSNESIAPLSLGYGVAKKKLEEVINYCIEIGLFTKENGHFYSERMVSHKAFRKSLSDAGIRGNKKRWDRPESPPESPPESQVKESKVKESKVKKMRTVLSPEDFTTSLKTNVLYKHIDIDRELLKANQWAKDNGRKFSQRFVKNWMNRIDPPVEAPKPSRRML